MLLLKKIKNVFRRRKGMKLNTNIAYANLSDEEIYNGYNLLNK